MYVCALYASLVLMEVKRRASNTLEIESLMVVSCHVGAGNQTQMLWKNS